MYPLKIPLRPSIHALKPSILQLMSQPAVLAIILATALATAQAIALVIAPVTQPAIQLKRTAHVQAK